MIIAIDGPAASGKGTLARKLAAHFQIPYLDTGSLYRAVALGTLTTGGEPADKDAALKAARELDLSKIDDQSLRTARVAEGASVVAAIPEVRSEMLEFQRRFAAQPGGAVLDGRDIGTVVCPDADVKLFVSASAEVRARRRFAELSSSNPSLKYEDVLADLRQRDSRDAQRAAAPMKPADYAHLLDTSDLDIEVSFETAVNLIESHFGE